METSNRKGREPLQTGDRIGKIVVEGFLGSGAFGELYTGVDEALQRQVVLKTLRSLYLAEPKSRERFLREARILSRLDHPNICRIFELVEDQGREILVLERIHGRDLSKILGESLSGSLQLSVAEQITDALAAAHSQGIVHRDLKPANVMLTDDGVVKVLDFGMARSRRPAASNATSSGSPAGRQPSAALPLRAAEGLTETEWLETEAGAMMGTPAYMSPEQARCEPTSSASDIFSLGLLLQELFTGKPAYDRLRPIGDLLLRISDGSTEPISDLDPALTALLGQMLHPEPSARPSAAEVRRGLRRVREKPRRRLQRLTAAAAILAFLGGGLKYTLDLRRYNISLENERRVAQEARDEAEQTVDLLVGLFEVSDPGSSRGATVTAREILDHGADRVRQFLADQPLIRARLLDTIGNVYFNLGLYEDAQSLLEEGLATRRAAQASPSVLADSLLTLGALYRDLGYLDLASDLLDEARRITTGENPDTNLRATLAAERAVLLHEQGQYAEADPYYREALRIRRAALGPDDPEVATSLNNLALNASFLGQLEEAEALLWESIAIREAVQGADHPDLADSLNNLAIVKYHRGQYGEAVELMERDLALSEKVLGPDHPKVAVTLNNLATLETLREDHRRARALFERALEISKTAHGDSAPSLSGVLGNLASALLQLGETKLAEEQLELALDIGAKALGSDHPDLLTERGIAAEIARSHGHLGRAQKLLEEGLEAAERSFGSTAPEACRFRHRLAQILLDQGQVEAASHHLALAHKTLLETGREDRIDMLETVQQQARLQLRSGDLDSALELFEAARGLAEARLGPGHSRVLASRLGTAQVHLAAGRLEQADDAFTGVAHDGESRAAAGLGIRRSLAITAAAFLGQGQVALARNDLRSAEASWHRARELAAGLLAMAEDIEIRATLTTTLLHLGSDSEAVPALQRLRATGWADPRLEGIARDRQRALG